MRFRFTIRDLLWLTLVVALTGCSRARQDVKTPDQMTLYSVNVQEDLPDVGNGRFHEFPVLGKIEITDANQRHEIMAAVMDGISDGGTPAACFWPRHAIRTVVDGKTIDYVICFHCSQIGIWDGEHRYVAMSRDAMPVLDKYLKAASIPQAPEVDN